MLSNRVPTEGINALLTTHWYSDRISTDAEKYKGISNENVFLYFFTKENMKDNSHRGDLFRWELSKYESYDHMNMLVQYFRHLTKVADLDFSEYQSFTKTEYYLTKKQANEKFYRGVVIYFRSSGVPINPKEAPHGNATKTDQLFVKKSSLELQALKVGLLTTEQGKKISTIKDINGATPRNPSQLSGILYRHRNPSNYIENMQKQAILRSDTIHSLQVCSKNIHILAATKDSLRYLLREDVWFTDTTFNVGAFYMSAVVAHNADFTKPLHVACMYIHDVS
jgi:hypothetical protein